MTSGAPEHGANVGWLMFHLPVGEAEGGQPRGGMCLITHAVPCLGDRRPVIVETIGLDDEAEIRPEEIDLEPVDVGFRQRGREARALGDRSEEHLQVGIGEAKGIPIQQVAKRPDPGLARVAMESDSQFLWIDQIPLVSVVDRPLEGPEGEFGGEVEQGAGGTGNGDAAAPGDVGGRQRRSSPYVDPGMPSPRAVSHADVNQLSLPQSAAALRWLNAAALPQASVAAIQRRKFSPLSCC